jgi:hypothetical protein
MSALRRGTAAIVCRWAIVTAIPNLARKLVLVAVWSEPVFGRVFLKTGKIQGNHREKPGLLVIQPAI